MNQITMINILQKIRSICKESSMVQIPERVEAEQQEINLEGYLKSLQHIRQEFIKYRYLQEQYNKLEALLQREETQLRKKIGVQHQLKLYTEALKTQVEELQKQKLQFLQNSKHYIKQLKKTNQGLYLQLQQAATKKKTKQNTPKRIQKSKINNKSLSQNKSKHDKSVRQIIKTQYIERDRSNSGKKRKTNPKKHAIYQVMPTNSKQAPENINTNSKTFQVFHNESNKKEKAFLGSRKKNNHLFSNFTLLNFLDKSNRKMRRRVKGVGDGKKSPTKQLSKRQINKSQVVANSKQLFQQKKANKSIYSVSSLEPHDHKKQTI